MRYDYENRGQKSHTLDIQYSDIEGGFPVNGKFPDRGEIKSREIPAGKVALCIHLGPYSEMEAAYNVLNQFVTEQGYHSTGIVYEYYYNNPDEVPPEEVKIRVSFPVE